MQKTTTCCDKWWQRLTTSQKEWVHYYFYDIEEKDFIADIGQQEIHEMHESRFTLEGYER